MWDKIQRDSSIESGRIEAVTWALIHVWIFGWGQSMITSTIQISQKWYCGMLGKNHMAWTEFRGAIVLFIWMLIMKPNIQVVNDNLYEVKLSMRCQIDTSNVNIVVLHSRKRTTL